MTRRTVDHESIISAALHLIREGGWEAVSARAIARFLHCSTMPIYSTVGSMENLRLAAGEKAGEIMTVEQHRPRTGNESLDLAVGYIAFAREEPRLFRFLMHQPRNRVDSAVLEMPGVRRLLAPMAGEERDDFLFRTWVFTHGLADLIASGAVTMTDDEIVRHLTAAGGSFLQMHQQTGETEEQHD
jgi:AcrR family transcriptional regulator